MPPKLIRITTIPLSLEKLLEGQLTFMQDKYEVIAISSEKEHLEEFGLKNEVRTYHVELTRKITPLKDLMAVMKMFRFFKKEKPLIVHTHTPKAGIVGMIAAKMAGVPNRLHTVAGLPLLESRGIKRKVLNMVEKLTYSFATKIYPNSYGLKEIILEEKFTQEEKLKVIGEGSSNGIDLSYFNPQLFIENDKIKILEELGIQPSHFIFIYIGRLVGDKGINELVSAFDQFFKKYPDSHLLLVGYFEENLDPLDQLTIEKLQSHTNISATGFKNDVRPYLAIANVLTFPSYREGFPNVILQAGAMDVPSIVTNINGCNEIIKEGFNGIIIQPKNVESLYAAMIKIYENPILLEDLKSNCRKRIAEKYERLKFWNLLLEEYKNLN